jgi:hypothetical protein
LFRLNRSFFVRAAPTIGAGLTGNNDFDPFATSHAGQPR